VSCDPTNAIIHKVVICVNYFFKVFCYLKIDSSLLHDKWPVNDTTVDIQDILTQKSDKE